MYVFIWKANEHRGSHAEAHETWDDGWYALKPLTIGSMPQIILRQRDDSLWEEMGWMDFVSYTGET